MRKLLLLLISLGIILGALGILGLASWRIGLRQTAKPSAPKVLVEQPAKPQVSVVIENGDLKIEAAVSAKTAYEALQKLASENKLEIKIKQYDFGVFVESINKISNNKNLSWIYFVNGKSADVAADKYELKEGDKVEWKYIKPIY